MINQSKLNNESDSNAINIIYYMNKYNKINGSFYYTIEYYQMISLHHKNTNLIICDGNDDQQLVSDAINDKYLRFEYNIIYLSRIQLYKLECRTSLFLDIISYNKLRGFAKGRHFVYSNTEHDNYRSLNSTIYFGYYDYQIFDIKVPLKLNFDYVEKSYSGSGLFISYPLATKLTISDINKIKDKLKIYDVCDSKLYFKKSTKIINNLFNCIDSILYIHSKLDTNNRIIIESAYHNKKLFVEHLTSKLDSVNDRLDNIKKNNLDKYILKKDDLLITEVLKYTKEIEGII